MEKLPINKIVPPIQGAGAAVMLQKMNRANRKPKSGLNNNSKTFFKGATSFIMQAESSMKMEQNDATIRSYLGIENAKMASSRSAIPTSGSPALEKAFSSEEPLDPRDFTRSVLE